MCDDCRAKPAVVADKAIIMRWDSSTDFSRAWSDAEQKAREPAHKYMEKQHSIAIYMYTNNHNFGNAARTGKLLSEKETSEYRSLYFSLSEAIQVLKHSQVTCLNTNYRTEIFLNLNISNKQVRFSSFMLASNKWDFTRNNSCFEINTCFGADITHYSALKQNGQVLIPPYEVFKVTDIQTDTRSCKVVYRLKSNLNCVYDRESNTLQPISALPVDGFWPIFIITCIIIVSLLLPFVIVKVLEYHKRTAVFSVSSNSTHYPAELVI